MSDNLHDLLNDLVRIEGSKSALLHEFTRLDEEREMLSQAVLMPKRKRQSFESARKLLTQLLESTDFDKEIAKMEYPSKLLKGPIDLNHARQKPAISELAVTLGGDPSIPENLRKLTLALQHYYNDYFDKSLESPQEDRKAEAQLDEFMQDPNRGAKPEYLEYQRYLKKIQEADKDTKNIESLKEEQPPFYLEVHALQLPHVANKFLKEHLLRESPWREEHRDFLQNFFAQEDDEELLNSCLKVFQEKLGSINEAFLNDQLSSSDKAEIINELLKSFSNDELNDMMRRSVQHHWHHLFSSIINIIGYDQSFFYFSISDGKINPDIFKKIVNALFLAKSPQEVYGIDMAYAEKVLSTQRSIPQNVLKLLQKTMPRGLDNSSMSHYIECLKSFNEECQQLLSEKSLYDNRLKALDNSYVRLMEKLSAVETIRFVLFTYLNDSLLAKLKNPYKLDLELEEIQEFLSTQYEFESSVGANRNIINYIDNLWAGYPVLDRATTPEN